MSKPICMEWSSFSEFPCPYAHEVLIGVRIACPIPDQHEPLFLSPTSVCSSISFDDAQM